MKRVDIAVQKLRNPDDKCIGNVCIGYFGISGECPEDCSEHYKKVQDSISRATDAELEEIIIEYYCPGTFGITEPQDCYVVRCEHDCWRGVIE